MLSRSVMCCLCWLLAPLVAGAVQEPKAPSEPQVADTSTNSGSSSSKPAPGGDSFRVTVLLEDGRHIQGTIRLQYAEFKLRHNVGGFTYFKTLRFREIREIRILRWKPVYIRGTSRKLYYFYPALYRITTFAGGVFLLAKRLKLLDSFQIENKFGKTRMFAYFADYRVGDKKQGHWQNTKQKAFAYNSRHPLGRTVRRIVFAAGKKEKSAQDEP